MSTSNSNCNITQARSRNSIDKETLNDDELLRYSRQILLDDWGIEAQERLKHSCVIIIGAGGLGCPVAETLARAGVGHIHLIDHDRIEASNLQRQTLFFTQDIGQFKAEKACDMLTKINEHIVVSHAITHLKPKTISTLTDLIKHFQQQNAYGLDNQNLLLLDCTDNFEIRELLNKVSIETAIPLLSASAIAMTGQLALYEPNKNTGCYHCVFGDAINHHTNAQNCATSGVLASTTTVMGNLQANLALQYLGLGHNPLQGQLLNWDGKRMSQYLISFTANKSCPVCS